MVSDIRNQEFIEFLPKVERFLTGVEPPRLLDQPALVRELGRRCGHALRRWSDGPHAPLRWAFFGPTGAGKSKLFDSLVGRTLSGSSYERPFTRRALYFVHQDWRAIAAALAGQVHLHEDAGWQGIVLVDTPDFDSVEVANRDEADRVLLEVDGFFFVTDALKYADASTWEYLERIHAAAKPFVVVLNKVNSDVISSSFDSRYRETMGLKASDPLPYETISVPEMPIRDDELIGHDSIGQMNKILRGAAGPVGRPVASVERYRHELEGLFRRADLLGDEVVTRRQQVGVLHDRLQQRFRDSTRRLEERLAAGLEPAVRDEVYQRVMKQLDSIDLLRYPRKIIAYPLQGLRSMWRRWQGTDDAPTITAPAVTDPVSTETFHMLESELIRFADESRLDIVGESGLKKLLDRDTFRTLRLEHAEIQTLYRQKHQEFRDWVEQHALDTASAITGENKLKFMLSQILFHTVLITAQVKTGGGLTLLEAGLDGVISPFVAKAVSIAIGNEKVGQFEADAHQKHQACLADILALGRQRFEDFLAEASRDMEALDHHLTALLEFRPEVDALTQHFAKTAADTSSPEEGRDG